MVEVAFIETPAADALPQAVRERPDLPDKAWAVQPGWPVALSRSRVRMVGSA